MRESLTLAVQRGLRKQGRTSRLLDLAAMASLIVYAGLVFVGTLFLVVTWKFPIDDGSVSHGLAALSTSLMIANALWLALILAEGVACFMNKARGSRRRLTVLVAALGLVALMHWLAVLVAAAAA